MGLPYVCLEVTTRCSVDVEFVQFAPKVRYLWQHQCCYLIGDCSGCMGLPYLIDTHQQNFAPTALLFVYAP